MKVALLVLRRWVQINNSAMNYRRTSYSPAVTKVITAMDIRGMQETTPYSRGGAAILVGGRSVRMGTDKAALKLDGQSLHRISVEKFNIILFCQYN